ncbi:MAG: L,D-transpeptidase [Polyangiaceae bacterium]|jgi:lipoprotein-anchoring transpeptidase ErfK/SrfK|nr:L,D-transpeptidase [Polyangiaceae bacterium]MBK8940109.1 L,D-transpeptidase [Polyangiaceae bacterium]
MKHQADTPKKPSRPGPWSAAPVVAFLLAALGAGAAAYAVGCRTSPDASDGETRRVSAVESGASAAPGRAPEAARADADGADDAAGEPAPTATSQAEAEAAPKPLDASYDGPRLGAMALQTPIYPEPRFSDQRLGYIRQGGKVPVDPKPIKKPNCKEGWYKLLEGGYVCGKYSTLDLEHPRVKLGVKQPDTKTTVPYQYAYNLYHGTPLYKALPTREEMLRYEPHLAEKEREKAKKAAAAEEPPPAAVDPSATDGDRPKGKHPSEDGNVPSSDNVDAAAAVSAVSAMEGEPAPTPEAEPAKPWWQTGEKNPNVSLSDLEADADGNLSKRMVKGFFIAVDKTFGWNNRYWYRTTSGLLAPSDRMVINKAPETKGIAFPEGAQHVFFALSDKAQKLELSSDGKKMSNKGKLARFAAVALTGKQLELDDTLHYESTEGFWVKDAHGTLTEPGKRPSDVGPTERWVDVNLSRRTLVLFEGDKPVYAALVSPGKRSKNKKKNHATPTGAWRIREKHIATTMDGDGAAGDLPYSIEDVPYVAYFKGSYALHAAFWHNNFGREMSHGCVNLAPIDARTVFDFVEPRVPVGWHGAFATDSKKGSMVVVHE